MHVQSKLILDIKTQLKHGDFGGDGGREVNKEEPNIGGHFI